MSGPGLGDLLDIDPVLVQQQFDEAAWAVYERMTGKERQMICDCAMALRRGIKRISPTISIGEKSCICLVAALGCYLNELEREE